MDNLLFFKTHLSVPFRKAIRIAIVSLAAFVVNDQVYATGPMGKTALKYIIINDVLVDGQITNINGEPIFGATISVKGQSTTTTSDADGKFSISAPDNATLVFSYVGYSDQEIKINNRKVINVTLLESDKSLDEVVFVGYGSKKKASLTTAVGSVEGKDIAARGTVSVLKAVQGQIAGVDINSTSGRAGAANYTMQVRGQNSLAGGQPLFVVDGVIVDDINFLNPQDIVKMDVLKDAASTAIYGSRGSNGVVLVSTKLGENTKGAPTISFDSYVGLRKVARMPDFMDGDQQVLLLRNTAITNALIGNLPYDANSWARGNPELVRRGEEHDYTDWRGAVLRDGSQHNHFLTVSGVSSDNNVRYLLGAGYQNEKGNLIQEEIDKYNFKASIDATLNDKWLAGINITYARSSLERGSSQAINNAFRQTPIYSMYDNKDGKLSFTPSQIWNPADEVYTGYGSFVNPVLELANSQNTTTTDFGMANLYLQYSPVKWINVRSTFSPRVSSSKNGIFLGSLTQDRQGMLPAASVENRQSLGYIVDNVVTLNKEIGEHAFTFTGLHSIQKDESEENTSAVNDLPFASGWYNLGSSTNRTEITSAYNKFTITSYMARLNYSYRNKYLVTLANRWDGSSKLSEDNRWATFPSAAVAWRISKEDFFTNIGFVSDLKLRFSAGKSGNNNNINPYETQALLSDPMLYDFGGTGATGYAPSGLANRALTWETTREYNLGVDYELFNGRISGSVDLYDKLSKGVLMNRNIPVESGWSYIKDNVGSVSNRGIELSLRTVNVSTKNLTWITSFTFSRNDNAIIELLGEKTDLVGNSWFIGKPVNVEYQYQLDGVWQEKDAALAATYSAVPGQSRIKDLNGDGKISASDDRTIIGQNDPKWIGGFSTQVMFKNFDLSIAAFAKQGHMIDSRFNQNFLRFDGLTNYTFLNVPYYMPANDVNAGMASNYYPQPNNSGPYWRSLMRFADASFVKIQSMSLGYTFSTQLMQKVKMKGLRLYVNVLDPFVFTKYHGFDPETDGATEDTELNDTGVASIVYQFGINLKF